MLSCADLPPPPDLNAARSNAKDDAKNDIKDTSEVV